MILSLPLNVASRLRNRWICFALFRIFFVSDRLTGVGGAGATMGVDGAGASTGVDGAERDVTGVLNTSVDTAALAKALSSVWKYIQKIRLQATSNNRLQVHTAFRKS
jgi:hypothetical protein